MHKEDLLHSLSSNIFSSSKKKFWRVVGQIGIWKAKRKSLWRGNDQLRRMLKSSSGHHNSRARTTKGNSVTYIFTYTREREVIIWYKVRNRSVRRDHELLKRTIKSWSIKLYRFRRRKTTEAIVFAVLWHFNICSMLLYKSIVNIK